MATALLELETATLRRFAPPPRMTLSAWADAYRVLPSDSSAEPGRWRTDRVPYLREPMDVIADRKVETVVLMASSQVGKTEVLLNMIGYHMHLDPCPMMLIEPTLEMAAAISKDRVTPMLRDTPVLRGLVASARAKDSSNTMLHKAFPGGALTLVGGNSPAALASRPIRGVFVDEADRIDSTSRASNKEGDPIALAIKRAQTFRRRKILIVSTPTVKGASRIEDWYQISDQRKLHVPCPRCSVTFVLAWEHIRWTENNPKTAHIECPGCKGVIEDFERSRMIAAGAWRATVPFTGIAGFHVWEAFAPWRSLADLVSSFLVSRHSLEMRQVFVNTSLGQVWETPGEKVEAASLLLRREPYTPDLLPAGVRVLTMGVDVQDDRLEALVIGWGPGEESWVIQREPLMGDPARADVWAELDEWLDHIYPHESGGGLSVYAALVDAGGHRTQSVYNAIIPRQPRRVFASFGRSGGEKGLIVSPPKAIRPSKGGGTVQRRIVDVDQVKSLIFARLRLLKIEGGEPVPEYIHFPTTVGETFFDELTAEKFITRKNKYGVPVKLWEQIKDRNESLDCFVLAFAAMRIYAPTPQRLVALMDHQAAARVKVTISPEGRATAPVVQEPVIQAPAKPWLGPRRGGWLRGDR